MSVGGAVIKVARLRGALIGLAMFGMPTAPAFAEPVLRPDLADRVAGREDVTFADLVRLVVPGTAGNEAIDVREIGSELVEDLEPASGAAPRLAAVPVRSGGLDRMAVLLDFGSGRDVVGLAVLALFDVAGEPRLLDAANVASGQHTYFLEPARMAVGVDDDLLAVGSTHANSSQTYTTVPLVLVRNDQLELVDMISAFDERLCAYERTQRLDLRHGAQEPFSDVVATLTEVSTRSGDDCGEAPVPEARTRTITVTYRWDAGAHRYIPDSDAFDVLARENEGRF
ncbi:hypothetical protein [Neoaquamicrobium sediminum]|uniref:Uncharacterized protein n=1 Tax=Neoaquamicrobium sediminum TaxID=1849104 RepID=A0ABV3WYR8_9HYPH